MDLLLLVLFSLFLTYNTNALADEISVILNEQCEAEALPEACPALVPLPFASAFDNVRVRNISPISSHAKADVGFYSYHMSNLARRTKFENMILTVLERSLFFSFFLGSEEKGFVEIEIDLPEVGNGKILGHELLFPYKREEAKSQTSRSSKPTGFQRQIQNLPHLSIIVEDEATISMLSYQLAIYCDSISCYGDRSTNTILTDSYIHVVPTLYDSIDLQTRDTLVTPYQYSTLYSLKQSQPMVMFRESESLSMIFQGAQHTLLPLKIDDTFFMKVGRDFLVTHSSDENYLQIFDLRQKNFTMISVTSKKCEAIGIGPVLDVLIPIEKEMFNFFFVLTETKLYLFNYKVRIKGQESRGCEAQWIVDLAHYNKLIANIYGIQETKESSKALFFYNSEIIVQANEIILRFDASGSFWKKQVVLLGGAYHKGLKAFKVYKNYFYLVSEETQSIMQNLNKFKTVDSENQYFNFANFKFVAVGCAAIGVFMMKMNKGQARHKKIDAYRRMGRGAHPMMKRRST